MAVKSLTNLDIAGKRVLIREDLNVPVEAGRVTSDARIRAALPTLAICAMSAGGALSAEVCKTTMVPGQSGGEWTMGRASKLSAPRNGWHAALPHTRLAHPTARGIDSMGCSGRTLASVATLMGCSELAMTAVKLESAAASAEEAAQV